MTLEVFYIQFSAKNFDVFVQATAQVVALLVDSFVAAMVIFYRCLSFLNREFGNNL